LYTLFFGSSYCFLDGADLSQWAESRMQYTQSSNTTINRITLQTQMVEAYFIGSKKANINWKKRNLSAPKNPQFTLVLFVDVVEFSWFNCLRLSGDNSSDFSS